VVRSASTVNNPWIPDGTFHLFKAGGRETITEKAPLDPYALEAERFAAVVQDGVPPFVSKADSLGNMKVLDELRRQVGLLPTQAASGGTE
jgi:predicted dehydrogenase